MHESLRILTKSADSLAAPYTLELEPPWIQSVHLSVMHSRWLMKILWVSIIHVSLLLNLLLRSRVNSSQNVKEYRFICRAFATPIQLSSLPNSFGSMSSPLLHPFLRNPTSGALFFHFSLLMPSAFCDSTQNPPPFLQLYSCIKTTILDFIPIAKSSQAIRNHWQATL